jgi:diguanylate cyclase (GGDEF)-like protein
MKANVIDHIDSGVAVIDVDYNIILINDYLLRIIQKDKREAIGVKCYDLLYNREKICTDCPHEEVIQQGLTRRFSHNFTGPDGCPVYITSHYSRLDSYNIVLTVRNTTRDVEIAQDIEKVIRDLQAQNALIKHKNSEIERSLRLAGLQLAGIKDGVLLLDKYFRVYTCNEILSRLLKIDPEEAKGSKCFKLMGHDTYCPGCPARKSPANLHDQNLAQEISVDNRIVCLCEYFTPTPDGSMVLTFRLVEDQEATYPISIIGQLEDNLQRLLKTLSQKMTQEDDPEKTLKEATAIIRQLSGVNELGIIIGNKRGIPDYVNFLNVPHYERNKLISSNIKFSRKTDVKSIGDYLIVPILGRSIPLLGRIFLRTDSLPREKLDLIDLIICYLADYMENNQLSNSLNTFKRQDLATFTLSRASFDEIFDKEVVKSSEYNLPLSVLILQINTFDLIGELYGESAANDYLKNVALVLKKNLRETDYVARYDQTQIIVLFSAVSFNGVKSIAERFQENCRGMIISIRDGDGNDHRVKLRMSLGFESTERSNIPDLIRTSLARMKEL